MTHCAILSPFLNSLRFEASPLNWTQMRRSKSPSMTATALSSLIPSLSDTLERLNASSATPCVAPTNLTNVGILRALQDPSGELAKLTSNGQRRSYPALLGVPLFGSSRLSR